MSGAIRNTESLKRWFYGVGAPFFTLFYSGTSTNQVIIRNTTVDEMDAAWELLEGQVKIQAEYGRALLHVIVYKKAGTANNPDGRTNIDIQPFAETKQMAGIGSLSAGYLDESKVAGLIAEAKEKWELERRLDDMEAQLNNPNDWTDKLISGLERISGTQLGQILAVKFLGVPLPAGMVAGTPPGAQAPPDEQGLANDSFDEDISKSAEILGVDDTTLARKLRQLVEANPELAKSILQQ